MLPHIGKKNLGEPLANICEALKGLAKKYQDEIHIVYPVHLNPHVQKTVLYNINNIDNISLIEPLDYSLFVQLLKKILHYFVRFRRDSGRSAQF